MTATAKGQEKEQAALVTSVANQAIVLRIVGRLSMSCLNSLCSLLAGFGGSLTDESILFGQFVE